MKKRVPAYMLNRLSGMTNPKRPVIIPTIEPDGLITIVDVMKEFSSLPDGEVMEIHTPNPAFNAFVRAVLAGRI